MSSQIPQIPCRVEQPVSVNDGEVHILGLDLDLPCVFDGMWLNGLPEMPRATDSDAPFVNRVMNAGYDAQLQRYRLVVAAVRRPAHTIAEVQEEMPSWHYIQKVAPTRFQY